MPPKSPARSSSSSPNPKGADQSSTVLSAVLALVLAWGPMAFFLFEHGKIFWHGLLKLVIHNIPASAKWAPLPVEALTLDNLVGSGLGPIAWMISILIYAWANDSFKTDAYVSAIHRTDKAGFMHNYTIFNLLEFAAVTFKVFWQSSVANNASFVSHVGAMSVFLYLRFLLMTFRVWFFNGAFRPHNPTPETPHEKWGHLLWGLGLGLFSVASMAHAYGDMGYYIFNDMSIFKYVAPKVVAMIWFSVCATTFGWIHEGKMAALLVKFHINPAILNKVSITTVRFITCVNESLMVAETIMP